MFGSFLAEAIGWCVLTVLAASIVWGSRPSANGTRSSLSRWVRVFVRRNAPVMAWSSSFDSFARYGALGIWSLGTLLLVATYLIGERGIARYEVGPLQAGQLFHFNAYLTNRGALNEIQWRGGAVASLNLKPYMADMVFEDIYRSFSDEREKPLGGFSIQRNYAASWLSANGPYLDQGMIDSLTSGSDHSHMYVTLVIRQKSRLSKQWTYTESCAELKNNGETTLCDNGHNRTYRENEINADCGTKLPLLVTDLNNVLGGAPKMIATSDGPRVTAEEVHNVYHKYFPIEKCKIEDVVAIARTSPFFVNSWEVPNHYMIAFSSGPRPGYDVNIDIDKRTGNFARPYINPNRYSMQPESGAKTP